MNKPEVDLAFDAECEKNIEAMNHDDEFLQLGSQWFTCSLKHRYTYNFSWLGVPVIQYPTDLVAVQTAIFDLKPSVIIETGIARGGSVVFYASLMNLLDQIHPLGDGSVRRQVIGVDIQYSEHTRDVLEKHPLSHWFKIIEGSSIDTATFDKVTRNLIDGPLLVVLDSNHTHEHVLAELNLYSKILSAGDMIIVFDTAISYVPSEYCDDRSWGADNSPLTAVEEFLTANSDFKRVMSYEKLIGRVSVANGGWLKRQ